jgi:AAA family ATP:ADP antiporter
VFRSRYLLYIALLILLLNGVNTTGEFILRSVVIRSAAEAVAAGTAGGLTEGEYIGQFYSRFGTGVNLLGLAIQLFLVSRIFKYFGMQTALLALPVIALGGYALIAFAPVLVLAAVRWVKTAENATDYSLQNTVRHALFLPTTREEKYKAKQAIDSFFWRAGDVMSAVLVFVGTSVLAFQTRHFAMVNLGLVLVWLVLAVLIGRRYRRLAAVTA